MTSLPEFIEFHRVFDGLIYRFQKAVAVTGELRYLREDGQVQLLRHKDYGWIVTDLTEIPLLSRHWTLLPEHQTTLPPEGDWVSQKGAKSYVYTMHWT